MSHVRNSVRLIACLSATAFAGVAVGALSAHAAPMAKPMHAKMASSKMVYVCNKCHEYWSPTAAKKMHYKDSMGHTMVKMSKAPTGYMDGSKPGAM